MLCVCSRARVRMCPGVLAYARVREGLTFFHRSGKTLFTDKVPPDIFGVFQKPCARRAAATGGATSGIRSPNGHYSPVKPWYGGSFHAGAHSKRPLFATNTDRTLLHAHTSAGGRTRAASKRHGGPYRPGRARIGPLFVRRGARAVGRSSWAK